jgi:hypothetical protein
MKQSRWDAQVAWMRAVGAYKAQWDSDYNLLSVELGAEPRVTVEPEQEIDDPLLGPDTPLPSAEQRPTQARATSRLIHVAAKTPG